MNLKILLMQGKTTVFDASLLQLSKIETEAGQITAVNNLIDIPFEIKRVYYLFDLPAGEARGGHAHKELHQIIIAGSGSFDILIDDHKLRRSIHLSQPNIGLYLPPGLWRELYNFSSGAICLVLASLEFNEMDYIRNYREFHTWKSF